MNHSPKSSPSPPRQLQQQAVKPRPVPDPVQANLFAQKLNNSAAFCIEIGQYDRAIASLGKALRLSEAALGKALHKSNDQTDHNHSNCLCHHCTIAGCISYSERLPTNLLLPQSSRSRMASSTRSKKQRLESSSLPLFKSRFWKREGDEEGQEHEHQDQEESLALSSACIYRRPIQVTPRSIGEGHNMGSTLFLVIVFNLALAHHLAASIKSDSESSKDKQYSTFQKNLKLYELADSMHQKQKQRRFIRFSNEAGENVDELDRVDRFEMILCNNSIHLYQALNRRAKHQECLQRLTSALMMVVDQKLCMEENTHHQVEEDGHCENDQSSCASENDHLEGFLQTATPSILRKQCADAA